MYFRSQKKTSFEVSLNETIDTDKEGNPLTYSDIISVDDTIAEDIDIALRSSAAKKIVLERLDDRARRVICLRYGLFGNDALTQREVAEKLGISRSYVSRIEKAALLEIAEHISDYSF
jgi:RNA polymerase sporulation-specific sigma factor